MAKQPATAQATDPQTGKPMVFDQNQLAATIHNVLFSTKTAMRIPRLIHEAYTSGDFSELAQLQLQFNQATDSTSQLIMGKEIWCYEPWAAGSVEAMKQFGKDSYYLNVALDTLQENNRACNLLPRPMPEAIYAPQSGSLAPVLVLVGELDDQNPLENMAGAQELWPNVQVVIEPGQGHASTVTSCRIDIENTFISDPLKSLDTTCLKDSAPSFDIP